MSYRNLLWWMCFVMLAVWGQSLLPGVDLLIVGVVLCLEEGRPTQTFWVVLLSVLLQEGAGTLPFGASILWYALVFFLYRFGQWLFQAQNFLFIFLMGACMAAWHYVLVDTMASLQDYSISNRVLLKESLLQAVAFPIVWFVVNKLRPKKERESVLV